MKHLKHALLGLMMAATAHTVYAETMSESAVRLRDPAAVAAPAHNNNSNLVDIEVTPNKKLYRVNESIKFKVKGKADYYLYVFTYDPATKKSVVLLPNANTKDNFMKKNKTYNIPGTVEFYSDAPGVENVMFVASREPVPLDQLPREQVGAFSTASTDDMSNAFSSKAIRLRDPAAATPAPQAGSQGVQLLRLQVVQ